MTRVKNHSSAVHNSRSVTPQSVSFHADPRGSCKGPGLSPHTLLLASPQTPCPGWRGVCTDAQPSPRELLQQGEVWEEPPHRDSTRHSESSPLMALAREPMRRKWCGKSRVISSTPVATFSWTMDKKNLRFGKASSFVSQCLQFCFTLFASQA